MELHDQPADASVIVQFILARSLKGFGSVGNLAEALMWARKNYGYDLVLSWAELDRSAEKFAAFLEGYRNMR